MVECEAGRYTKWKNIQLKITPFVRSNHESWIQPSGSKTKMTPGRSINSGFYFPTCTAQSKRTNKTKRPVAIRCGRSPVWAGWHLEGLLESESEIPGMRSPNGAITISSNGSPVEVPTDDRQLLARRASPRTHRTFSKFWEKICICMRFC